MCIKAFESDISGKTYFVSDGKMYLDSEYAAISKQVLNKKTIKLKFPLFIVRWISCFLDAFGGLIGKQFTLNKDKYSILAARNWDCDIEELKKDLQFEPQYDLQRGVEETIAWYKQEKCLHFFLFIPRMGLRSRRQTHEQEESDSERIANELCRAE